MNQELLKVRSQIISNKLTLNLVKTHYIIFHRKKLPPGLQLLTIGETVLERVTSMKFLGIMIQKNLKWNEHVQNVARKIDKLSGICLSSQSCQHVFNVLPQLVVLHIFHFSFSQNFFELFMCIMQSIVFELLAVLRLLLALQVPFQESFSSQRAQPLFYCLQSYPLCIQFWLNKVFQFQFQLQFQFRLLYFFFFFLRLHLKLCFCLNIRDADKMRAFLPVPVFYM